MVDHFRGAGCDPRVIEKVVYDGRESTVSVTFRPTGIKDLARRGDASEEETAA